MGKKKRADELEALRKRAYRTGRRTSSSAVEERRRLRSVTGRRVTRVCAGDFELREGPSAAFNLGPSEVLVTGVPCRTNYPYTIRDFLGEFEESSELTAFSQGDLLQNPRVVVTENHDFSYAFARTPQTLKLREVTTGSVTGLYMEATFDTNSTRAADLVTAIDRGDMREMSYSFVVDQDHGDGRGPGQVWNEDYTKRRLTRVLIDQCDVAVCSFGANSGTENLISVSRDGVGTAPVRSRIVIPSHVPRARQQLAALRGRR